jgi:hypothetical protein
VVDGEVNHQIQIYYNRKPRGLTTKRIKIFVKVFVPKVLDEKLDIKSFVRWTPCEKHRSPAHSNERKNRQKT